MLRGARDRAAKASEANSAHFWLFSKNLLLKDFALIEDLNSYKSFRILVFLFHRGFLLLNGFTIHKIFYPIHLKIRAGYLKLFKITQVRTMKLELLIF